MYWFVEYLNPTTLELEHNDIVKSFDEFASLSQGRIGIITGPATQMDWVEAISQRETSC